MWKKEYAGRYVNTQTGWIVERALNYAGWYIINPETKKVFDRAMFKKLACKWADVYAVPDDTGVAYVHVI